MIRDVPVEPAATGLERPRVLVATGGLIASGKSTLARCIAAELGAATVVTDRAREVLAKPLGGSATNGHEAAWLRQFAPGFTEEIYAAVLERARRELAAGRPVVVDGCFASRGLRAAARKLAREIRVPFLFVECRATPGLLRRRLVLRALEQDVDPAAWLGLLDSLLECWQPVDELDEAQHLVVDTAQPLDVNVSRVVERLDRVLDSAPPDAAQR